MYVANIRYNAEGWDMLYKEKITSIHRYEIKGDLQRLNK